MPSLSARVPPVSTCFIGFGLRVYVYIRIMVAHTEFTKPVSLMHAYVYKYCVCIYIYIIDCASSRTHARQVALCSFAFGGFGAEA